MGESDRVKVPDRVEPACTAERSRLMDSIMAACVKPAPATSSASGRNILIFVGTFGRADLWFGQSITGWRLQIRAGRA